MVISKKVTVLMPVYNAELFLKSTVESILFQTYKDFEFLIVDDGSIDGSSDILASFDDPRIKIIRNKKNLGLIESLNKGLSSAVGEYVARMDADDIANPERLYKQINFLDNNPTITVVGSYMKVIDKQGVEKEDMGKPIRDSADFIFSLFEGRARLFHPSVMYRKEAIIKCGGYNTRFEAAEDYELWSRLALCGHKAAVIEEPLVKYRIHRYNICSTKKTVMKQSKALAADNFIKQIVTVCKPEYIRFLLETNNAFWQRCDSLQTSVLVLEGITEFIEKINSKVHLIRDEQEKIKYLFIARMMRTASMAWKQSILSQMLYSLPFYFYSLHQRCIWRYKYFWIYPFIWLFSPIFCLLRKKERC